MTGSDMINANRTENSREKPRNRPVHIVVPERDRPGSTAKHWPMPTINASSQVASFSVLCFFGAFSDRNRIAAVTRSISPTTRDEENAPSILSLIHI